LELSSLKNRYESAQNEVLQREQRIQQLMSDLKVLEDRCIHAENQYSTNQRLNEEIERLNSALRDIAHAVVQDADSGDAEETHIQHMHLSQSAGLPANARSPKRNAALRSSQVFAESTISAVQAAFHKYQLTLHDLQVKLQSNSETLATTKKQLDVSECTRESIQTKLNEITENMDTANYQLLEIVKERDSLQKTLDDMRTDKHSIERGKAELNSIVSEMYEKMKHEAL
jgi:rootletin